jgi:hypothetical protein
MTEAARRGDDEIRADIETLRKPGAYFRHREAAGARLLADLERKLAEVAALRTERDSLNRQLDTPPWTTLDQAHAELAAERARHETTRALPGHLAEISRRVTASYPAGMDPELVMRRRVGKIGNEYGELLDAIEGWTGENPRKGIYATKADVIKELLDCASASLCATEHLTGDQGEALALLAAHVQGNHERLTAALAAASPSPVAGGKTGWDYAEHPGDCHPRKIGAAWVVCCRECAGTGVFPVPWINTPEEGRKRMDDSSCVSCKGTGYSTVSLHDEPVAGQETGT